MTDADAIAYVNAVEAADGQLLEFGVGKAINDFVVGCKLDNTWSAIKASCILAGARTLTGALVPLVGTAPTNVGGLFVSGDYNRKTGLAGNGSTKYLNSNRNNNADPQNSQHLSAFVSTANTSAIAALIATTGADGASQVVTDTTAAAGQTFFRSRTTTSPLVFGAAGVNNRTGFHGMSRSSSTAVSGRVSSVSTQFSNASTTPLNASIGVFNNGSTGAFTNARLAFYSIGESLDLALLDARVSALITAFGVAIP
jgi:uncharacterized protein YgbK (DUF1537 family)